MSLVENGGRERESVGLVYQTYGYGGVTDRLQWWRKVTVGWEYRSRRRECYAYVCRWRRADVIGWFGRNDVEFPVNTTTPAAFDVVSVKTMFRNFQVGANRCRNWGAMLGLQLNLNHCPFFFFFIYIYYWWFSLVGYV